VSYEYSRYQDGKRKIIVPIKNANGILSGENLLILSDCPSLLFESP
jgi:hypothetical protein